jgi:hypothetical protein
MKIPSFLSLGNVAAGREFRRLTNAVSFSGTGSSGKRFCQVPQMETNMRILIVGGLAFTLMTGAAAAATSPVSAISNPVPFSQVENIPDRVASARVTDADGIVIGAVQKVELRGGKPTKLDIALIGSENTVTLDASTVRYDAATNVVATTESASQLAARPKA